jgi:hypothetical protein
LHDVDAAHVAECKITCACVAECKTTGAYTTFSVVSCTLIFPVFRIYMYYRHLSSLGSPAFDKGRNEMLAASANYNCVVEHHKKTW